MLPKYGKIQGISYGRVSTNEQAFNKDGSAKFDASPQMQRVRCQQFIDSLNLREGRKGDYEIIEHLSDDGFSGKNTKRPSYKKLWDYIGSGKINFIVSSELSRLSRNTADFLDFISHCEKHNVDVMILNMNLDTTSPYGRVMITILVSLAQFEREMTSTRVKENARARLLNDGKINGAGELLGLDKDPNRKGHFIINPDEVKTLEQIFEIFINSSSRADTLRALREMNIKSKHGKEWTKQRFNSIFEMVKTRYRGVWPITNQLGQQQLVKLPHGPVLNESLLNKVEERLKQQIERKRWTGNSHVYLLTTLLTHEDGSNFTGQPAKQRQYRYYHNKQNNVRIRCDELDTLVLKRLNEYLLNFDHFKSLVHKASIQKEDSTRSVKSKIVKLENELLKNEKEEDGIKSQLLVTPIEEQQLIHKWLEEQILKNSQRKNEIQVELEALRSILDEFSAPVQIDLLQNSIKTFLDQFKGLPTQNKRGLLERFFQKIVIKTNNVIELHIFEDVFKGSLGKKVGESSTIGKIGCLGHWRQKLLFLLTNFSRSSTIVATLWLLPETWNSSGGYWYNFSFFKICIKTVTDCPH